MRFARSSAALVERPTSLLPTHPEAETKKKAAR
jgi:hypothetical protein